MSGKETQNQQNQNKLPKDAAKQGYETENESSEDVLNPEYFFPVFILTVTIARASVKVLGN